MWNENGMNIVTYSILDDSGRYIGFRKTNSKPLGSNIINAEPPKLSDGQTAYWCDGQWKIVTDTTTIPSIKKIVINKIDDIADSIRIKLLGNVSVNLEYQQVVDSYSTWYLNGYKDKDCPEEIISWANAEGISIKQASIEIAEAAAYQEKIIKSIRSIRLAGKSEIRNAADDSDFDYLAETYINALVNIEAIYS